MKTQIIEFERSSMRKEAKKAKRQLPVWALAVVFLFVWGMCMRFLYPWVRILPSASGDREEILVLCSHAISMGIFILFGFFVEKRSLRSMGFDKKRVLLRLITGMLFGVVSYGAFLLICQSTGAIHIYKSGKPVLLWLYLIAYMIQSAEEELAVRGWLMTSVMNRYSVTVSVLISAALFTLPHYINRGGFEKFYILNVFLMGILLAVFVLRTDSIWGAIGMHGFLNWVGCVCGAAGVGGPGYYKYSTIKYGYLTGGAYGFSAGLGMTIVECLGILFLLFFPGRLFFYGGTTWKRAQIHRPCDQEK